MNNSRFINLGNVGGRLHNLKLSPDLESGYMEGFSHPKKNNVHGRKNNLDIHFNISILESNQLKMSVSPQQEVLQENSNINLCSIAFAKEIAKWANLRNLKSNEYFFLIDFKIMNHGPL